MCLGLPAKVVKIEGTVALVDISGVERKASIELLEDIKPGDYVLLHAGCAIQKLDPEEAEKTLDLFKEIEDIMHG